MCRWWFGSRATRQKAAPRASSSRPTTTRSVAACSAHGIDSILTSKAHQSGTDRLAEAARLLALDPQTIVVNVQADEPLLPPAVVRDVAQLLHSRTECEIATAAHSIVDASEFFSPDVVKVVVDVAGTGADVFARADSVGARCVSHSTRASLPAGLPAWRHVGLYAYRAAFLARFPRLPRPAIEEHEKLEQLRALAHGIGIAVLQLTPRYRRESTRPTICSASGRWSGTKLARARLRLYRRSSS